MIGPFLDCRDGAGVELSSEAVLDARFRSFEPLVRRADQRRRLAAMNARRFLEAAGLGGPARRVRSAIGGWRR